MNDRLHRLLNDQINMELYSAYLYLDLSNHFTHEGLDGFANWYRVQAQEERDHAMRFMEYLGDNGLPVELKAVDKPSWSGNGFTDPLVASLEHERKVTAAIDGIYKAAKESDDYRTMIFLAWFIDEQCEEEKNASDMLTKMKLYGMESKALYLLNDELKGRTYKAPHFS